MNNPARETRDNGRFHSSAQNPTGGTKRGLAAHLNWGQITVFFLTALPQLGALQENPAQAIGSARRRRRSRLALKQRRWAAEADAVNVNQKTKRINGPEPR